MFTSQRREVQGKEMSDQNKKGMNEQTKALPPLQESLSAGFYTSDALYRPEAFVYFDFLRPATGDVVKHLSEKKSSPGSTPTPVKTPEALEDSVTSALAKLYTTLFDKFISEAESWIRFIGFNVEMPSDLEKKQHFINVILNTLLSGVQITRKRDTAGIASINFRAPLKKSSHQENANIFFSQKMRNILNQMFSPHVFVHVYGKGRLFTEYYYAMFTGLTLSTTFGNSQGFPQLTIQCEDVLKLFRLSNFAYSPGTIDFTKPLEKATVRYSLSAFFGKSVEDIVKSLILGVPFATETSDGTTSDNAKKDSEVAITPLPGYSLARSEKDFEAMLRVKVVKSFSDLASNLSLLRKPKIFIWGIKANPYVRLLADPPTNTFESTFKTRLEILRDVAVRTFSEFYADSVGNLWFHPMRVSPFFLEVPIVLEKTPEENSESGR